MITDKREIELVFVVKKQKKNNKPKKKTRKNKKKQEKTRKNKKKQEKKGRNKKKTNKKTRSFAYLIRGDAWPTTLSLIDY